MKIKNKFLGLLSLLWGIEGGAEESLSSPSFQESAGSLGAFQAASLGGTGQGGELKLDAQTLEIHHKEQIAIAKGKAFVQYKDITLRADELKAYYRQKKGHSPQGQKDSSQGNGHEIWRLEAKGRVQMVRPSQSAYGEEGFYDLDEDRVRLTGENLKLVSQNAEVTADKFLEFWRGKGEGIAEGNATVRTKNHRTVRADRMIASFEGAQGKNLVLKKVVGIGHVVISTGQEVATGQSGIYDHARETALLEGKVRLQRGENWLTGHRAEVNLKTGVSRLLSQKGKPVAGVFMPETASKGKKLPRRSLKK